MKRLAIVTSIALVAASSSFAGERSVNLSVPGMFCASCPFVVEAAIGEVDGVLSVATDVEERTAHVLFDDSVATVEAITTASTNAGYEATVIASDADG